MLTILLSFSMLSSAPAGAGAAPASYKATCDFSNPGFSGHCFEHVTIGKPRDASAACGQILDCLNSSMCTKTYCSATTIRGGWKLESAKVE
jgi:hypothetical protein